MTVPRCRLVTRSDFDGVVCAVLLKELGMIDQVVFAHPKDVQDGLFSLGPNDITTNLPYSPYVHLSFDHHFSETIRVTDRAPNSVIDPDAPSAARVVYEYFGGESRFPGVSTEMLAAVDKADSGQFSYEEIVNPSGWVLLNFIMDPRTGIERFRDFRISSYDFVMQLVDMCRGNGIEEILASPDVRERIDFYFAHEEKAIEQLKKVAAVHGKTVVLDLRNATSIWCVNRFMIYALFPHCNVSIHMLDGFRKRNTVLAVGKSVLNRTSAANIGAMMLHYGGGGHRNAGTCQVPNDEAARVLHEVLDDLAGGGEVHDPLRA